MKKIPESNAYHIISLLFTLPVLITNTPVWRSTKLILLTQQNILIQCNLKEPYYTKRLI